MEICANDIARTIVDIHGPQFVQDFENLPTDATVLDRFCRQGLGFYCGGFREAIAQLLRFGAETVAEIVKELEKRLWIDDLRRDAIARFDTTLFHCMQADVERPYCIDGIPVDLRQMRERIVKQFGEDAVRQSFVHQVRFSNMLQIKNEDGIGEEWMLEAAAQRSDWYAIRSFAEGGRTLGRYTGTPGWEEPCEVDVFSIEGRKMQWHLRGCENWKERELYGTVIHELGHGLHMSWTAADWHEWTQIAGMGSTDDTYYLSRIRRGVFGDPEKLRIELFCERLKIFCTRIRYLERHAPLSVAFIRKKYPGIKDSQHYWPEA